jgi:hypothetical protein
MFGNWYQCLSFQAGGPSRKGLDRRASGLMASLSPVSISQERVKVLARVP